MHSSIFQPLCLPAIWNCSQCASFYLQPTYPRLWLAWDPANNLSLCHAHSNIRSSRSDPSGFPGNGDRHLCLAVSKEHYSMTREMLVMKRDESIHVSHLTSFPGISHPGNKCLARKIFVQSESGNQGSANINLGAIPSGCELLIYPRLLGSCWK